MVNCRRKWFKDFGKYLIFLLSLTFLVSISGWSGSDVRLIVFASVALPRRFSLDYFELIQSFLGNII